MFSGKVRWLVLAGLTSSTLLACGSDSTGDGGNTSGSGGSASTAGTSSGGSSSPTAGTSSVAGTSSGGGQAGSSSAAGSGGMTGGGTGGGSSGTTNGGSGGGGTNAGGSGGASGGSGGGAAMPTAVANIMGLNGKVVTGTATFTQGAAMTTLVLDLTACPDGVHASHLHENPDCGQEGNAAAGHWMPNGVDLGDYTCAGGKVTYTTMKPVAMWTVGDGSATDITKHAFMVHEAGDAGGNPGARIGCGVPMKK